MSRKITPSQKRKATLKKKKQYMERIKRGITCRNNAFRLQEQKNYSGAVENFRKALKYFPPENIRYAWTVYNLKRAMYLLYEQEQEGKNHGK